MSAGVKLAALLVVGVAGVGSGVERGDVVVRVVGGAAGVRGAGGAGEVVVTGRVDAPPGRVWDVLKDQEAYPRIFREIRKMKYVRPGDRGDVWRADVTLPWPLGDQWSEDEVTFSHRSRSVRWYHVGGTIRDNTGSWRLQPLGGGGTLVVYRNRFDPGVVLVPQWLVTWAVSQGIPKIMLDLRVYLARVAPEETQGGGRDAAPTRTRWTPLPSNGRAGRAGNSTSLGVQVGSASE